MKFIIRTKTGRCRNTLYFKDVGMGVTPLRSEAHIYDSEDYHLAPFIRNATKGGYVVVPVLEQVQSRIYRGVFGALYKLQSGRVLVCTEGDNWVVSNYGNNLDLFQDGVDRGYLVEVK